MWLNPKRKKLLQKQKAARKMYASSVDIKELVDKVENSNAFKDWDKKDNYLINCFYVGKEWSIGYFSKKSRKITAFKINETVKRMNEESVLSESGADPEQLDIQNITISLAKATNIVDNLKKQKAPGEDIVTRIFILQQKNFPMWNMTYATSSFNLLNVKINAISGKIASESFARISDIAKKA